MKENLKTLRLNRGFSQRQIATILDISESYYCLIENGERRPSVEVAKRIAAVLGFDWQKFYEE
ncbi:MAG TPA: helix-turn-helix transcriptional regulator [Clostridia bacterium]|nr:helix-turn-helix transcriptional regulator [Clostridia bacterium]